MAQMLEDVESFSAKYLEDSYNQLFDILQKLKCWSV